MTWKNTTVLPSITGFREPAMFNDNALLQQLTLEAVAHEGSDLYIQSGYPVLVKVHGAMLALTSRALTTPECLQLVNWAAGNEKASGLLAQGQEVTSSYNAIHPTERDGRGERRRCRFRVNAIGGEFRNSLGVQMVMRSIRSDPPSVAELGLPSEIVNASTPENGIFYIVGSTGSGKSTTFAALVRNILEGDTGIKGNIVTAERPIEFVYDTVNSSHSVIHQSEVGRGVASFSQAIISFMRHDPSLIIVGETRDEPTASASIAAANTGHPVYTTMHANSCSEVFTRILSFYSPEVRDSMLFSVVSTARVLMSQRLVPAMDGKRVALREFLVVTDEMREAIINRSDPRRITSVMKEMVAEQGKTMASAAKEAFDLGLISEAVMNANTRG
jgi:defect-in-organelle-trafficking protein DotB